MTHMSDLWRTHGKDPRWYQIAALASLLAYGIGWLEFDVSLLHVVLILGTVLAAQYLCTHLWSLPTYDPKSALISGLSLCLLLRTNWWLWVIAAAALTIASKFVVRWNGKHVFNPTNFGLVVTLLLGEGWVSAGQWGAAAFFSFLVACLGSLVVTRAARHDVTGAFLCFYAALLFTRAWWLGDPLIISLHQLQNGALLLFAFFMISDPKTTPESRAGRILFALLVAFGAVAVQFGLYRPNGLQWSLAASVFLVPLINRLFPGFFYEWNRPLVHSQSTQQGGVPMKAAILGLTLFIGTMFAGADVMAFCGFYVSKADSKLYNQASRVVIARQDDKTVMTMANDFKGDPKEFAIVIPVPTLLTREQIHVGDRAVLDHIDAYSAPRLVEYFDGDPCLLMERECAFCDAFGGSAKRSMPQEAKDKSLGVTIEARYTIGEYDILILSAQQSHGLETWLTENGYRIPAGASRILGSYLKQGMKFFVAKVNLEEQMKLGFTYLRPLQVAYESPKFMLPIRLGTVNANGSQELFVYTLTRKGRVETTNYRTVKMPSDVNVPVYVKHHFADFYRALFTKQVSQEDMRAVFLEYAWDMNWCDPCAADPLSDHELRELGVFWIGEKPLVSRQAGREVFVTRLHVRYDAAHFPEDLTFQETTDRTNYQGRYIMRHPWTGVSMCPQAEAYRKSVTQRQETEAQTLAGLTGWDLQDIRRKIGLFGSNGGDKWYHKLWPKRDDTR